MYVVYPLQVKQLQQQGEKVYHFAFGQSPFPIMDHMVEGLKEFAHENAYLPVTGKKTSDDLL